MKVLVTIPENMEESFEEHRKKYYPDMNIQRMLIRISSKEIEDKKEVK